MLVSVRERTPVETELIVSSPRDFIAFTKENKQTNKQPKKKQKTLKDKEIKYRNEINKSRKKLL